MGSQEHTFHRWFPKATTYPDPSICDTAENRFLWRRSGPSVPLEKRKLEDLSSVLDQERNATNLKNCIKERKGENEKTETPDSPEKKVFP